MFSFSTLLNHYSFIYKEFITRCFQSSQMQINRMTEIVNDITRWHNSKTNWLTTRGTLSEDECMYVRSNHFGETVHMVMLA